MQRLIVLAGALAVTPVFAQENAGRETGPYLRGAAGIGFADSLNQQFSYSPVFQPIVAPPTAKSTELGNGLALSAAIGFQYARTRTEIEYRRFEASADEVALTGGAVPSTVTDAGDVTAQAIMSNVYFDLVNASRFTPYIGVGVGGARVTNELGERDGAFAYQGRVGVEAALTKSLSFGVEYSYFRTLGVVYGPEEFDASIPATPAFSPEFQRLDGDPFASSAVMATIRLQF